MFPQSLVNFVSKTSSLAVSGTKRLYNFSSSALWIASTSFTVLALPLIFEVERAQAEEAEKQQQRQVMIWWNYYTSKHVPINVVNWSYWSIGHIGILCKLSFYYGNGFTVIVLANCYLVFQILLGPGAATQGFGGPGMAHRWYLPSAGDRLANMFRTRFIDRE